MPRHAPRTAFKKGQSGNPKRRPKGVPNKVTREVRLRYQAILEDPKFVAWLTKKIRSGKASDQLLTFVHHYAYGRPAQAVDLNTSFDPLKYLADVARQAGVE